MPLFILIRHGENEYVKKGKLAGRLSGVHLNKDGQKQAELVAEKLSEMPIKAVYSSPLERAIETASPIALKLSLSVIPREGLTEVDIGEWQGMTVKSLRKHKLWKNVQGCPARTRFPGGETFSQAQFRICQEFENLSTLHEDKDMIVCVSHADPIKLATSYYLGLPLDFFQRLQISPASITILQIGITNASLLTLNHNFSLKLPKS